MNPIATMLAASMVPFQGSQYHRNDPAGFFPALERHVNALTICLELHEALRAARTGIHTSIATGADAGFHFSSQCHGYFF